MGTEGSAGGWGGRGGGPVVLVGFAHPRFHEHKGRTVLGLDFLPCDHPRLKGDFSSSARPKPCSQWDRAVCS